jgi:hypothetical protein
LAIGCWYIYKSCAKSLVIFAQDAIKKIMNDLNDKTTGQQLLMTEDEIQSSVDKGLIAMFLKMSVEERLLANDNAVNTILELRDAFRQKKQAMQEGTEDELD